MGTNTPINDINIPSLNDDIIAFKMESSKVYKTRKVVYLSGYVWIVAQDGKIYSSAVRNRSWMKGNDLMRFYPTALVALGIVTKTFSKKWRDQTTKEQQLAAKRRAAERLRADAALLDLKFSADQMRAILNNS